MSTLRLGSYRTLVEGEFIVASYRGAIAPGDNAGDYGGENKSGEMMLQFYAVEGGLRTVRLSDFAEIK